MDFYLQASLILSKIEKFQTKSNVAQGVRNQVIYSLARCSICALGQSKLLKSSLLVLKAESISKFDYHFQTSHAIKVRKISSICETNYYS